METPKVTIIIPTYNRSHLIKRAIDSILNQTYANFQILVFDDSRDDKTKDVVKQINDKRIKYVKDDQKRPLPAARNESIKIVDEESKYIAFLDDDDEFLPKFLERTIAVLEQKPEIDAVMTSAELRRHDGEFIKNYLCEKVPFWNMTVGNGTILRKKALLDSNIWWDEKTIYLGEDLDFGARFLKNHQWECLSEILRVYYGYPVVQGQSMTTSFTKDTPTEGIEYFFKKNEQLYKESGPDAYAWVHFLTGKTLCRSGKVKEGRHYLSQAIKIHFTFKYLVYYLIALIAPGLYRNMNFIILKHKISNLGK